MLEGTSGGHQVQPQDKAGSLQLTQVGVHIGLEYLQRKRFHKFSGEPVPVLRHSGSKIVLPCISMELSVF